MSDSSDDEYDPAAVAVARPTAVATATSAAGGAGVAPTASAAAGGGGVRHAVIEDAAEDAPAPKQHRQEAPMAAIMRQTFGDLLYVPAWEAGGSVDPMTLSPLALQRRILVKGKRVAAANATNEEDDHYDVDDESMEAKKAAGFAPPPPKEQAPSKIAAELSALVFMESKHLSKGGWAETNAKAKCYEVVSLSEGKAESHAKNAFADYVRHNSLRFARIYPAGHRVDSSNYHPQQHWNAGCQIVALNWQTTKCSAWRLNRCKFLYDNGNAGYLLKPPCLRTGGDGTPAPADGPARRVVLRVVSAFGLPKPGRAVSGETVDPYVKAWVEGPGIADSRAAAVRTPTVDDDGFHPIWAADPSTAPPLALACAPVPGASSLVLRVYDEDKVGKDELLGEAILPVHLLRPGMRCIPLHDERSREILGAFVLARIELA